MNVLRRALLVAVVIFLEMLTPNTKICTAADAKKDAPQSSSVCWFFMTNRTSNPVVVKIGRSDCIDFFKGTRIPTPIAPGSKEKMTVANKGGIFEKCGYSNSDLYLDLFVNNAKIGVVHYHKPNSADHQLKIHAKYLGYDIFAEGYHVFITKPK